MPSIRHNAPFNGSPPPLTRNLDLGGNNLIFDDLMWENYANNWMRLVEKGTDTYRNLRIAMLMSTGIIFATQSAFLQSEKTVNSHLYFQSWDGAAHQTGIDVINDTVRMPRLPGADPTDGTFTLWSNGGVVTVGT